MGGKVYTGRALIQFDCSQINDVTVKSAFLCIYPYDCFDINAMWDYNMRNGPKEVFKVTKKWDEATANWKNPWAVEGGDFDESNPLSSSSQKDTTVGEWELFDVTEAVKQHVQNPAINFGFLIKFDDNDRRGIMVYSAQNEKADMRPKLEIIFNENTPINNGVSYSENLLHEKIFVNNQSVHILVPGNGKYCYSVYTVSGRAIVNSGVAAKGLRSSIYLGKTGMFIVTVKDNKNRVRKKMVVCR